MKIWLSRFAVLMIATVFVVGATTLSGASGHEAKALFETKCSKCHGFDKALGKSKTMDEWKKTVAAMQKKSGDWISDKEAATIVDYLTEKAGK